MTRYVLRPGVRVEPLGESWVAYSPASGETLRLNVESAAVLELLDLGDESAIVSQLSRDTGVPAEQIASAVCGIWPQLLDAGLVAAAPGGLGQPDPG